MIDRTLHSLRRWSRRVLRMGLLFVFVLAVAACGGAGSNGGDDGDDSDGKYPEPPNRPSAVTVDAQPHPHV